MIDDGKPELIAIDQDDYHAQYAGHTADGRQFFLTNPFIPALNGPGNEFLALYIFDEEGRLIEAKIDEFGPRASLDIERSRRLREERLKELGDITFGRIEIQPFSVEKFGTEFGLIPVPPEGEDGAWTAEMQPGNFMAFFEPWDSGEYDT